MKPLFNFNDLDGYKGNTQLPFECENCTKTFYKIPKDIRLAMTINVRGDGPRFCSIQCCGLFNITTIKDTCANCGKDIVVFPSDKKKSKSGRSFCNHSCAATYNNTHKTTGYRRSKLEKWLEIKFKETYSSIEILYNDKTTINSELDFYIPSLSLAIELNGIFHYEPIYGVKKLDEIQNNDKRKFQACIERGIELVIIDTSQHKYVKESTSMKYWNIIKEIIDLKLEGVDGHDPTTS